MPADDKTDDICGEWQEKDKCIPDKIFIEANIMNPQQTAQGAV